MTIEDRLASEIGKLVIQLHQKAAQLDLAAAYVAQLEKTVADLKVELANERDLKELNTPPANDKL